jgi:hypothetical protein
MWDICDRALNRLKDFPVEAVIKMAFAGYLDRESMDSDIAQVSSGDRFREGCSIDRLK